MLDGWGHGVFHAVLLALGQGGELVCGFLLLLDRGHAVQHLVDEFQLVLEGLYQFLGVVVKLRPFK